MTPAQAAASWDSCGGFCDPEELFFGGSRKTLETTADASGSLAGAGWSANLVRRVAGYPVRDFSDEHTAGRVAFATAIGRRLRIRASHLISRTTGDHEAADPIFELGAMTQRSFLNLRGVAGQFTPRAIDPNPLDYLYSGTGDQLLAQYFSNVRADVDLWRGARQGLAIELTAGLHRVFENTKHVNAPVATPIESPAFYRQSGMGSREATRRVAVDYWHDFSTATARTSAGYFARGLDQFVALRAGVVGGEPSVSESGVSGAGDAGWFVTQDWALTNERAHAALGVRREKPKLFDVTGSAFLSWHGNVDVDLWGKPRGNHVAITGSVGQVQSSPAAIPQLFFQFLGTGASVDAMPETRREGELGMRAVAADGRVRVDLSAFRGRSSDVFVSLAIAPPGDVVSATRGDLTTAGVEVAVRLVPWQTPHAGWEAAVLIWNAATTIHLNPEDLVVLPGADGGVGRRLEDGESITRLMQFDLNGNARNVGDATPSFSFAQENDFHYGRLRLTTQLDGSVGVDVVNRTQMFRDGSNGSSPDQPDGGLARYLASRAGTDTYVQDGGYVRLREIVLSYQLGVSKRLGRAFASGARVEFLVRNAAIWSGLDAYDPTSRPISMPTNIRRVAVFGGIPTMRTFSLALVLGGG